MSDDIYNLFTRFQTLGPGIGPRERAPMLAQELACVRHLAVHGDVDRAQRLA
ncbi:MULTISPECIES: hypothetical protein [unclassified Pseudomonas]|uniref:hypothetical protein n=1 Tax=unclassified Pseudomonas TaxID=196821 RepID=UPI0030D73A58